MAVDLVSYGELKDRLYAKELADIARQDETIRQGVCGLVLCSAGVGGSGAATNKKKSRSLITRTCDTPARHQPGAQQTAQEAA